MDNIETIIYADEKIKEIIKKYNKKYILYNSLEDIYRLDNVNYECIVIRVNNYTQKEFLHFRNALKNINAKRIVIVSDKIDPVFSNIAYEKNIHDVITINDFEELIQICRDRAESEKDCLYNIGDIQVNQNLRIYCNNYEIHLSVKEMEILSSLIKKYPNSESYEKIYDDIWGDSPAIEDKLDKSRCVANVIRRLRKKIKDSGSKVTIVNYRKEGYKIE